MAHTEGIRPTMESSDSKQSSRNRRPRATCRNAFVLTYRPAEGESYSDTRDAIRSALGGAVTVWLQDSATPSGTERKIFLWTEKRQRVESMWFANHRKKWYVAGRVTGVSYPAERQSVVSFWEQALTVSQGDPEAGDLTMSFTALVDSHKRWRAKANIAQQTRRREEHVEAGGTDDPPLPTDGLDFNLGMECFVCGTSGSNGKSMSDCTHRIRSG